MARKLEQIVVIEDSPSDIGPQGHPSFENQITSPVEWLTSDEAATYLRISVGNLRNETSNGNIPFYKLGRRNRYLKSELTQLLLSSRRGGIWE